MILKHGLCLKQIYICFIESKILPTIMNVSISISHAENEVFIVIVIIIF